MKKTFLIIGSIVVGIIVIVVIILAITSATSKKMVCKSNEGNITIMYNDKTIKRYTANGMSYNLDQQQKYAEQIGIDAYLTEFSNWFSNNTTGTCSR